jgi:hypothetical protein
MPARRQLWTPGGGGQHVEQLGVVARAGPVGVEEWRCSAARPAECSASGKLQWPGGGVGAGGRLGLVWSALGTAAAVALLTGGERKRWLA